LQRTRLDAGIVLLLPDPTDHYDLMEILQIPDLPVRYDANLIIVTTCRILTRSEVNASLTCFKKSNPP
jgi:hypothetical protein